MTVTAQLSRVLPRWAWQVPIALGLAALAVAAMGIRPMLVVFVYLAAVTGELCRVDAIEHRLPNALTLPGYGVALVGLVWQGFTDAAVPVLALGAGAAYLLFLLLMHLAGGMGMGDVKLAGVLGISLGSISLTAAFAGPVLAFLAGGLAGLGYLLAGARGRHIPFGPFMLLGFWTAVVVGIYT